MLKLGKVVATANFINKVGDVKANVAIYECLPRHQRGDWGGVDSEDAAANNQAVKDGSRVLSSYKTESGIEFWIITEADRSVTTVLLPEDY